MTIVIAVLATAFVAAVVIGVASVLIIRQKKTKADENFEMELKNREEKVRDASREGTLIYKKLFMYSKSHFLK
jgi:Cu/Ag efflux pump CusA